ncbi:hypothetical protein Pst134EB_014277 [Puccinia striiformis f. sp. tritici]|nr:hypothetical protein Pst134EB_014277 [Puccinia striiformis f. sp. tritici]
MLGPDSISAFFVSTTSMHLVARECADLAGQNSQKAHRHVKPNTSALQLRQSVPERLSKRIFTIIFERLWVERYQNSHTVNLKEINSVISLVELLVQLKLKDYSFVIYFLPLHNHQTRWFMVFVKSIQARCFLPNTLAM